MRALILAPFTQAAIARLRHRIDVVHESWLETGRLHDPEELGARLAQDDVAFLVVEADFVFEEVFAAAPGLRFVGICRNALNHVDLEAATVHGIAVAHAPGRNTNAVSELAIGLMIALARRIPDAHALVAGRRWSHPAAGYRELRGREIAGSTVGIIGFGQIGSAVARKCAALGANVMAYDPVVPATTMEMAGATPSTLEEVAAAADFVTLHAPDSARTRHLVDSAFIARMKPDAYLVNTGGGGLVDAEALAEALESRRIAGAALDVFEGQPLPHSSPLLTAPNLILTPHIGGATRETVARHSDMIASEIERMLDGQPLQHVVNSEYANARAR